MFKSILKSLLPLFLILFVSKIKAQDLPASWSYEINYLEKGKVEVAFDVKIDEGWHIYTQKEELASPGGSTYFDFTLDSLSKLKKVGTTSEPEGHTYYEEAFEQDIKEFKKEARFVQVFDGNAVTEDETINAEIIWLVCQSDGVCQFPDPTTFEIIIEEKEIIKEKKSFWGIFIAGFLGGLLALLTPCVFPMIPMTVSFFTKQSENRAKGISNAFIYGLSIIVLYVALGLGVTLSLGAEALNEMSTSVWFNLFFFVVLLVFAASFLGAFEITLPNSWVNKMDSKADKGGLIGIFFMAFTLALVSFSCTGPVIGTLLVEASTIGVQGPFFGMLGFSIALALPFTLFAVFPGWMNSLPQSGGWLNSVKVVLGLLEIALAMKFLSNADLVYQWGILTREVFIAIWIVVFALIGVYLLGMFKMPHDSDLKFVSVPRLFLAIITFSFVIYMIPGMFGAPLKLIAGFPPPDFYSEGWTIGGGASSGGSGSHSSVGDAGHCPNNLPCFHDYEEGVKYAKEQNKPILLDFTGWACVNCREMEKNVWVDAKVDGLLRDDYVVISLYVDDKKSLPESEKYTNANGKEIEKIGQKWMDFQISKFGTATQPYYVLVDHDGEKLVDETKSYDPDINDYVRFLNDGLTQFKNKK